MLAEEVRASLAMAHEPHVGAARAEMGREAHEREVRELPVGVEQCDVARNAARDGERLHRSAFRAARSAKKSDDPSRSH